MRLFMRQPLQVKPQTSGLMVDLFIYFSILPRGYIVIESISKLTLVLEKGRACVALGFRCLNWVPEILPESRDQSWECGGPWTAAVGGSAAWPCL